MSDDTTTTEPAAKRPGIGQRMLGGIERVGNKVPHPAILFLALIVIVIVLSQLLAWAGVSATYEVVKPPAVAVEEYDIAGSAYPGEALPAERADADDYEVVTETAEVEGLLTVDGIRFLFTSFVPNFMGFTAMGIILIVMIGVGVAELSGLIAALIRRLVAASSGAVLTYIIVFLGVISSVASDAGYLVLIPLGAAAFHSVGRHPLAGMAAAFAGVAGGFGVNFLITPTDAILTEVANESIALVGGAPIDLTANLYFSIVSTVMITIVGAVITSRVIEPRLGAYDESEAPEGGPGSVADAGTGDAVELAPEVESRALRMSGLATLATIAGIAALTIPSGAPLRDAETGDIMGTSPFMGSLVVIISLIFFAAGLAYGRSAGTLRTSNDVIAAITKSWQGLAGLLFLFLLIAQFIAYFNYSNMATIAAVKMGDALESANVGSAWLLMGVILLTMVVNLIIPQAIAKWALLAPIFIPLFDRLGVEPQTVLAAYRIGDSPTNVITPIMAYFPLIVVFAARYQRSAGIGTVMALMIPYAIALTIAWIALFLAWYLIGIPLGPGSPV
jgi:aminobenzoyl-glutamate transport protein